MSKSTLATEVAELQGNSAFLSEFLDVPVFNLTQSEPSQTKPIAKPEATAEPVAVTASQEKMDEKPVVSPQPTPVPPPVVAKVVMTKTVTAEPPKKNYQGKYVIWTASQPTAEERVLIKKIIEAVRIPAASLVLETANTLDHADWSSTPFVFAFGIQNLPGALNTLSSWEGTRLLKTCTLAELNADLNQKKALWLALKQAFKL